ncbi:nitronate monooxygenase [Gemmobacter megaterium]|uniref:Nitronate monooxygenase n=1 Tax=Gemmobacter megaterium TaxID=1086013 RepID=A0A1N7N0K7_9RHOB|nr:nitronate monooxygenase family protein [Gemmobacter megaterium]GGE12242.1 2-nitropropane dioxygenase [Gemmobacter megaterium]SIS91865.1 nitronate monooxygenase [Gemmobacter megaterium]
MPLPLSLGGLRVPAIASPMFLTSGPDLVVECCNAGVIGTFPSLNQRSTAGFVDWLDEIGARLRPDAAAYGVNLVVRKSNPRLQADLAEVVAHKVPLVITALGISTEVVQAVHSYGGVVFHDVISRRHAEKAAEAGVDGIIAVAAGSGGHSGAISPFALVSEIRQVFDGTIILGGAINTGAQIAAARMMGADLAYLGTRFIATREAGVPDAQKQMMLESRMADIVYTAAVSGVNANFLRPSLVAVGLDPDNLPDHADLRALTDARAWSGIWSAGQGVGGISDLPAAADLCARLIAEYRAAMQAAAQDPFAA